MNNLSHNFSFHLWSYNLFRIQKGKTHQVWGVLNVMRYRHVRLMMRSVGGRFLNRATLTRETTRNSSASLRSLFWEFPCLTDLLSQCKLAYWTLIGVQTAQSKNSWCIPEHWRLYLIELDTSLCLEGLFVKVFSILSQVSRLYIVTWDVALVSQYLTAVYSLRISTRANTVDYIHTQLGELPILCFNLTLFFCCVGTLFLPLN